MIDITSEARIAIRMWRAMLYLTQFDELQFTRPLASFSDGQPVFIAEFDASLTGVGVLVYERVDGTEMCVGGGAVDIRGLGFEGDSAFQNIAEYIGAIVGLGALIVLGTRCNDIEIRGDSIAALTWAQTERARGQRVTNASMVFTTMCIKHGMDVKVATHIRGEDNFRCDQLSRLVESERSVQQTMEELGLGESGVIPLQECEWIRRVVGLCDPGREFKNEKEFVRFWEEVTEAIEKLGSPI
jgi:ribonuclease HI